MSALKTRKDSVEVLRIASIMGIIIMHSFSEKYNTATGIYLFYGNLINSVFNCGVTIFMLISGYYGIKFSFSKLISTECMCIFYSLLSFLTGLALGNSFSLGKLFESLVPISSVKYWFVTAYMIIFVFSSFINRGLESLTRKGHFSLAALMLFVFSIIPSLLKYHVMNDSGKGVLNMLLVYIIGRYLGRYVDISRINKKKCLLIAVVILGVEFSLNYSLSVLLGGVGIKAVFARDCSVFIIFASVFLFLPMLTIGVSTNRVYKVSKHVLAIYLFEDPIRQLMNEVVNKENGYDSFWRFLFSTVMSALITMIICISVDWIRSKTFARIEPILGSLVKRIIKRVVNSLRKQKFLVNIIE